MERKRILSQVNINTDIFMTSFVMGMRLENDTEYNIRIADEQKKLVAAQKKSER